VSVYPPQTLTSSIQARWEWGGTINRAELTGIAAAITVNCTQFATDSAYSLFQIRKQLLFPEMQRGHPHAKLLEHIAYQIDTATPNNSYNVKAHTGIVGNECADAIAKHAAVLNNGHDVAIPPPTPDGNPYSHMYWIIQTGLLQMIQQQIKPHQTSDSHPYIT